MRRAISTVAAAVALVLGGASLSPAQIATRIASSGHYSVKAGPPRPPAPPPMLRNRPDVNCSVSRGRLLGGTGGLPLLAPNYLSYPLGYGYTPPYQNYYTPAYENTYTLANGAAGGWTSHVESRQRAQPRRVRSRNDLAKSERLIASGDARFAEKQYVPAITRYREAARAAPDSSEARLRQALALIAAEKYSAAARVIDEALALRADWSDSKLRLDQLYGQGESAKTTDALTRKVTSEPWNGELAMALGVQLYFSGQREKAKTHFARAIELGADRDDRLSALRPSGGAAKAAN